MSRHWFGELRDRRLVEAARGRDPSGMRPGGRMAFDAAGSRDDAVREREARRRRADWLDRAQGGR